MAFRDNSTLIRTATVIDVVADGGLSTVYTAQDDTATAFVVEAGNIGDDQFANFTSNDSIINTVAIFDGNRDGFIQFGGNGVLDIDRSARNNPGNDQVQVTGNNGDITELRYLGAKNGGHVYADSAVLKNLWTPFGRANVLEGDVTNDTFDMGGGAKVLLHDNALGLNLGGDTITNFGNDDLLVTTSALFDRDVNMRVDFGSNQVLDTSGAGGPASSDPFQGPGGQLDFGPDVQSVKFLGTNEINGVTYYYYGSTDTTATVPVID